MAVRISQLESLFDFFQETEDSITQILDFGEELFDLSIPYPPYASAESPAENFISRFDASQFEAMVLELLGTYDDDINGDQPLRLEEDFRRQIFDLGEEEEEKPGKKRYEAVKKRRAADDNKWRKGPRVRSRKQPTWRYG